MTHDECGIYDKAGSGHQTGVIFEMSVSRGSYIALLLFVVLVLAVGFTIGLTIRPGEWYQSLAKPWFTPPNCLFAPAWTLV
jgi:translocator protein